MAGLHRLMVLSRNSIAESTKRLREPTAGRRLYLRLLKCGRDAIRNALADPELTSQLTGVVYDYITP